MHGFAQDRRTRRTLQPQEIRCPHMPHPSSWTCAGKSPFTGEEYVRRPTEHGQRLVAHHSQTISIGCVNDGKLQAHEKVAASSPHGSKAKNCCDASICSWSTSMMRSMSPSMIQVWQSE